MPTCELRLIMPAHPEYPALKSWYILAFGRGEFDTCLKVARHALVEICENFEEEIEFTPARFCPVTNQTTANWIKKVEELEKIDSKASEYAGVFTVRNLHALDALYEDQFKEKLSWMSKCKELEEVTKTNLELFKENLYLKYELDNCRIALQELQQKIRKKRRNKKIKKGKRMITENGEPAYGRSSRDSPSGSWTASTEESAADNYATGNIAG